MRVRAALEPIAAVRHHAQPAAGAAHGGRLKIGGLEQDVRGRLRHAAVLATHDASECDGALLVGNDKIASIERVSLAVERGEGFTFRSAAHDDAAIQLRRIESMQRLAHFHQHVVRDVHDVVDGPQADALEFLLQPVR